MTTKSPITTHILDISRGAPAAGVAVRLECQTANGEWEQVGTGITNDDGRVSQLLTAAELIPGSYRLVFATGDYFRRLSLATFYPQVVVEFSVSSATEHYHVPLLLSPFGYSTYRGS
jgi:5-hydroxyisourate hydrolase